MTSFFMEMARNEKRISLLVHIDARSEKKKALRDDRRTGDHIDASAQPIDKPCRQPQFHYDDRRIENQNPFGISSGTLNGDVDVIEKRDDHSEQLQPEIRAPVRNKFFRCIHQAQELRRERHQDKQYCDTERPAHGKHCADTLFYQHEIAGPICLAHLDAGAHRKPGSHRRDHHVDLGQIRDRGHRGCADM